MDDRSPDPAADAAGVVVLLRVHLGALLQREVLCLLGQHGAAALSHPREHRPLQSLNPAGQTLVSPILEVPQCVREGPLSYLLLVLSVFAIGNKTAHYL